MTSSIYLLDTNAISDVIKRFKPVHEKFENAVANDLRLILCQPVHYEVVRGLLWINATSQLENYRRLFMPMFRWEPATEADWNAAAVLWADATRQGRKLSDVDLLIAVMTQRLQATLISSDTDFDAFDIPRINWRD
jgi:predicted nucleic acid-binding protein